MKIDAIISSLMDSQLIGVLVGALITYFAAVRLAKKQQYYAAAGEFRAEFVNEIIRLRSASDDACVIIRSEVVERHKKAKVRFEPYLPKRKRQKFNDAWEQYENVFVRTKARGSIDNRRAECNVTLKQIESFLKFAKI